MADTALQFALREWRRQVLTPAALVIMAGVAAVLTLAGPFNTGSLLPMVPLFLYWLALVVITYSIGVLSGSALHHRFGGRLGWWGMALAVGAVTGVGATVCTMTLNLGFFGYWPQGIEALQFVATVMAIALIVTVVLQVVEDQVQMRGPQGEAPVADARPAPPPILDRLPFDKRGRLLSLSVEDHYVRIRTHLGEEVVLMRLADAMREVGATEGLQVHRSHWVALGEVQAARREKDRAILTLSDGSEVPVSRANLPKIKEAGLLPR